MELKIGDVLCYRVPKERKDPLFQKAIEFIQMKTDGVCVHVAMIIDFIDDNYCTVQCDASGVKINNPVNIDDPDIAIVRPRLVNIIPENFRNVIRIWYSKVPKQNGKGEYDYFGAARAGFWEVVVKFFQGKLWARPILPNSSAIFCSESVGELLNLLCGWKCYDPVTGLPVDSCLMMPTKHIYANRKQFELIRDFA